MCQNDPERTSLPASLDLISIPALHSCSSLGFRNLALQALSSTWKHKVDKGSVSRTLWPMDSHIFVTKEDLLPQGSAETAFSNGKQVWNYCRNSGRMCLIASLQGLVLGPDIAWLSGVVTSPSETRGEIFQVVPISSQAVLRWGVLTAPPPSETQSVSTQRAAASHFVPLWRRQALKQQRNCLISLGPFLSPAAHDFLSEPLT